MEFSNPTAWLYVRVRSEPTSSLNTSRFHNKCCYSLCILPPIPAHQSPVSAYDMPAVHLNPSAVLVIVLPTNDRIIFTTACHAINMHCQIHVTAMKGLQDKVRSLRVQEIAAICLAASRLFLVTWSPFSSFTTLTMDFIVVDSHAQGW